MSLTPVTNAQQAISGIYKIIYTIEKIKAKNTMNDNIINEALNQKNKQDNIKTVN